MDLTTRSRFYESLATAIEAGLPVAQALSASAPHDRSDDIESMSRALSSGQPLSAVLRQQGDVSPAEATILRVGESSGRLVSALRRLGARLAREAAFRRRLIGRLAYPALLLHAAVLLPTLPLVLTSGLGSYGAAAGSMLLGLYAAVLVTWLAWRRLPMAGLMLSWPVVGTFLRSRATAEYAFVLGTLVGSGAPLPESLKTAAQSVDLKTLRAAGLRVAVAVRSGGHLGQAMAEEKSHFGKVMAELVNTGEVAGKLDSMLDQAEADAQREAERAGLLIAVAISALALATAALVVASVVIGFWSGYAQQLEAVI